MVESDNYETASGTRDISIINQKGGPGKRAFVIDDLRNGSFRLSLPKKGLIIISLIMILVGIVLMAIQVLVPGDRAVGPGHFTPLITGGGVFCVGLFLLLAKNQILLTPQGIVRCFTVVGYSLAAADVAWDDIERISAEDDGSSLYIMVYSALEADGPAITIEGFAGAEERDWLLQKLTDSHES